MTSYFLLYYYILIEIKERYVFLSENYKIDTLHSHKYSRNIIFTIYMTI